MRDPSYLITAGRSKSRAKAQILSVFNRLLDFYALLFSRPFLEKYNRLILLLGMRGLGIRNRRTEYLSGETYFVRKLIPRLDKPGAIVVDVGANEGDFTQVVLTHSSHLNVFGLEPHPQTFERLQQRFRNNDRVQAVNCAAGAMTASLPLYDYEDRAGSQNASLYKEYIEQTSSRKARSFTVTVRALDDLLRQERERICLVKIDVEGFELQVIKGAAAILSSSSLEAVILEFNEMHVNAHTFLKDLIDRLQDFTPYRVLPGGRLLPLSPYSAWRTELFTYQNIAFVRTAIM
jgi:FkbM family methyltransferase